MLLLLLFVLVQLAYFVHGANTFCEMSVPSSTVIHRFEGKMNVPNKPKVQPGAVLFLWPGLNPYGGQGGLMQPVLTYGGNGCNTEWCVAQWFSDCPDYCHDKSVFVQEGDTILFYMQYIETYPNNSQHWEMGWHSYNSPNTKSTFQVYREGHNVEAIWATESEFYLNCSDPDNFNKLPSSYFYTWDMYAFTNKNNQSVPLKWSTHYDPTGNRVNCTVPINGGGYGTKLIFPPYNNGCTTSGYTRDWNAQCQTYCGCNNKDGTKKVQCDYCCSVQGGNCKRENGPSSTFIRGEVENESVDMIHPGNITLDNE